MTRICKHCKEPHSGRSGRGLCRACWDKKWIRAKYPIVASFGGKEASMMNSRRKASP